MELPPAHGCSLWIVPPEPIYSSLKDEITRQSIRLGTPEFEPHLTLVGGLKGSYPYDELVANTLKFIESAATLKPILVEVHVATSRARFYQCVYLLAKLTDRLRKLHELARVSLQDTPTKSQSFMPHMSIVYGDIPLQARIEVVATIEPRYKETMFLVQEMQLWRTEGPPDAWHQISTFEF